MFSVLDLIPNDIVVLIYYDIHQYYTSKLIDVYQKNIGYNEYGERLTVYMYCLYRHPDLVHVSMDGCYFWFNYRPLERESSWEYYTEEQLFVWIFTGIAKYRDRSYCIDCGNGYEIPKRYVFSSGKMAFNGYK